MRDSMFSALFGAMSNEHRVNMTANNLANINTNGYKRDTCAFQDTFLRFAHDYVVDAKPFLRDKEMFPEPKIMARPRLAEEVVDLSQGAVQKTGNPLDLAIDGDGFFKVQKEGEDFYTRNGSFKLTPEGQLVTAQGYSVLAGGGPVNIPQGSEIQIDGGGTIRVDGQDVAQLDIVSIDDPKGIKKEGENLFAFDGEEVPSEADILQGYLEKSNVEIVTEMVSMIESQRSFEMYQKMLRGTDQMDKTVINKVGRIRA